jgi:hypothetical protein
MTRKRFVKLLMSHGEKPRDARAIAFKYNARGVPYKEAYRDYRLRRVSRSFVRLSISCKKLCYGLTRAAQALKKFLEVINNA